MADGTSGYDAFISYSHTLDGVLARALQTGLERFAKPWYRPRALRVFRDTTNLAANPDLWSSTETALASSTWLVLMASPNAAQSKWVNREVAWWLENKSPQRLLVVLTEGEFTWDDDAGDGDGAKASLPPALRGAFAEEPRWVDLRWLHDVDQVDQSNPRLQEVVADVAAAIREVPKDVLVGEHIRQHRRTMRLARGGVTALAVLLIAAAVAAVVAVGQLNHAREQARIVTDGLAMNAWGLVAICLASAAAGAVLSLLLSGGTRGRRFKREAIRLERSHATEDRLLHGWPHSNESRGGIGVRNRVIDDLHRDDVDLSDPSILPVTIYLSDELVHEQVEIAVEDLLSSVGGDIVYRNDPERGSWFRRVWARMGRAAHSPLAHEATKVGVHAVESRLVLAQDATVTATMLQNLGPVLAALQPTKDAVIRAGALLIVKVDGVVVVHQLTASQQLKLDHQPQLAQSPHDILAALGLRVDILTQSSEELDSTIRSTTLRSRSTLEPADAHPETSETESTISSDVDYRAHALPDLRTIYADGDYLPDDTSTENSGEDFAAEAVSDVDERASNDRGYER